MDAAYFYQSQGQLAEVEPLYQRALRIREQAVGPNDPVLGQTLEDYAALLQVSGREAEARAVEARLAGIRSGLIPPSGAQGGSR